jgi:hypothetical protein
MNTSNMTLDQEMVDRAAKSIATEIDREVLWGLLKDVGWTRVMLTRLTDNNHAIDITYWLEENCKNPYERRGRDFLFESEKDAVNFILRWS